MDTSDPYLTLCDLQGSSFSQTKSQEVELKNKF